jgi:hypothetical protein
LPGSIRWIGGNALVGPSLCEIVVEPPNERGFWTDDGVLYRQTELFFVPEGKVGRVVVPGNVDRLRKATAFSHCTKLTEIDLSRSQVRVIPGEAFRECGVKKMWLPGHLETIDDMAFKGCEFLTEISIPGGSPRFIAFHECLIEVPDADGVTNLRWVSRWVSTCSWKKRMRVMPYAIAYCDDVSYLELPLGPGFQVEPFAFAHSRIDYMDVKCDVDEPGLAADCFLGCEMNVVCLYPGAAVGALYESFKWAKEIILLATRDDDKPTVNRAGIRALLSACGDDPAARKKIKAEYSDGEEPDERDADCRVEWVGLEQTLGGYMKDHEFGEEEVEGLVIEAAAERKPLFGNPDAYHWGLIANPRDPKSGARWRRGRYIQLTVKEYLWPVADNNKEYMNLFLDSWERLRRESRLLFHTWNGCNVILVTTKIDPKCQLLSDWGREKPAKQCLIVLDQIIVCLSALMKNCLVRSHKELRPGNILVLDADLAVEIGFPLVPGISLKLMEEEEKKFIAPEVLNYQQTWDDPSPNTNSSRDDALPDEDQPRKGPISESWTHACPEADVFSFGQLAVFLLGGDIDMMERPLTEAFRDNARARNLVDLLRNCCIEDERQRNVKLTELVTRWRKIYNYAPGLARDPCVT